MTDDIGAKFRELHRPGDPYILANAWDIGSAKMLEKMGAKAIGTSSAAHAFTLGRPDMGHVSLDEALSHASDLVDAVNVPVSGDFENGFGAAPDTVAQTVRLSFETGLAGISIEDTALPDATPYEFELAVERIAAAVSAARALPKDFVLVARADGVMNGQYDIQEALRRIRAYDAAGADCLYVPMPENPEDIAKICAATDKPVNALAAGKYTNLSLQEFANLGVARISLGSALARITHRAIHDAGRAMFEQGDFKLLGHSISGDTIDGLLSQE